jgi:MvaI/BcnI restriction endonuclease family
MFNSIANLLSRFSALGAVTAFCKPLAENDNSKQQIYLGGSLEVMQMFPFQAIETSTENSTYKAKLDFVWVGENTVERAIGTQLILYPQYPEVRLSGFLRGCKLAPNEQLRPVPANQRRFNNGIDGRVLFFGITNNGETLAYLAAADSQIAREFQRQHAQNVYVQQSIFFNLPLLARDTKSILLEKLAEIRDFGWQPSIRLNRAGEIIPYKARNGGGYTLEALLDIIPNGRAEPDFMGWELKAYSGSRITLMTPEPNGGMYFEQGVKAFVRQFGSPASNDTLYFTGTHRANLRNEKTRLTLNVRGFSSARSMIEDVNGAVELLTDEGDCAAAWSFADLMISWNKKHAQAAYIPYESEKEHAPSYRYFSPALLGEGTDFNRYLISLNSGLIIFDPGSKVMNASTAQSSVKARSQFRIPLKQLSNLYHKFESTEF